MYRKMLQSQLKLRRRTIRDTERPRCSRPRFSYLRSFHKIFQTEQEALDAADFDQDSVAVFRGILDAIKI
jgi:hypothetical protein